MAQKEKKTATTTEKDTTHSTHQQDDNNSNEHAQPRSSTMSTWTKAKFRKGESWHSDILDILYIEIYTYIYFSINWLSHFNTMAHFSVCFIAWIFMQSTLDESMPRALVALHAYRSSIARKCKRFRFSSAPQIYTFKA